MLRFQKKISNNCGLENPMIIPYTLLDIGSGEKSSLDHIIIGPCPHMALSKQSVQRLLFQAHIKAFVKRSTIPFRDW